MSRLLFTKTHKVQQFDGKGPLYEAGKVYDFEGFSAETYAAKYKRLGYAVDAPKTQPEEELLEPLRAAFHGAEVVSESAVYHDGLTGDTVTVKTKRRGRPPKNA
jgi:hypothetical protein